MLQEAERTEVVPGLLRSELNLTISSVCNAHNNGFMMAWQNTTYPEAMGFCYIVNYKGHLVTIRANAANKGVPLNFLTGHHFDHSKARRDFVEEFLKASSADMGGDFAEIVNYIAEQSMLWRFKSVIDGKFDHRWRDNSAAWQALWGRIIESSDKAVAAVPLVVRESVRTRLMSFAIEGQIVLDR